MDVIQIYRNVIKFFERHKLSISPQHKRYLKHARRELVRLYPTKQDQEMLEPYSDLILSLFLLDLESLRPQLQAFYHPKPRGALPRDPIRMFRSLLCMESEKKWGRQPKSCRIRKMKGDLLQVFLALRVLASTAVWCFDCGQ